MGVLYVGNKTPVLGTILLLVLMSPPFFEITYESLP
jgi:hypothetical protein